MDFVKFIEISGSRNIKPGDNKRWAFAKNRALFHHFFLKHMIQLSVGFLVVLI